MDKFNIFSSISERDLDLLVLEELSINDAFARWFIESSWGVMLAPTDVKVWHSVTDAGLGESDLILTFATKEGTRAAVLIENKINAPLQPQQPERYHLRGISGKDDGFWTEFRTCLISPKAYLEANDLEDDFHAFVTYEEIQAQLLKTVGDVKRGRFRSQMIAEAIEKNRRGYVAPADPTVSRFWKDYWLLASEVEPQLRMESPGPRPVNSDWPRFVPPGLPEGTCIVHKMKLGFVDLEIRGGASKLKEFATRLEGLLETDMSLEAAGKSAVVRLAVPAVDRLDSFEEQRATIKTCINTAARLVQLGRLLKK